MHKGYSIVLILLFSLTIDYIDAQIEVLSDSLRKELPLETIQNIDSLTRLISNEKSDKAIAKLYHDLGIEFSNFDLDQSIKYGNDALRIAEGSNFKEIYADIIFELGRYEFKKGNYSKAKKQYELALSYTEYSENKTVAAKCYNALGVIVKGNGQNDEAVKYYYKSLKEFEKLQNKEGISMVYLNLSAIFRDQKRLDEAEAYVHKTIALSDPTFKNNNIPLAYQYLGIINGMKGDLDEAICYINQSVNLNLATSNQTALTENYNNLAAAYNLKGDKAKSLEYLKKATKIHNTTSDKYGEAHTLSSIGGLYKGLKNYKEAVLNINKSLVIAKEENFLSLEMSNYRLLSEIQNQTGDYKNAYLNHVQHTTLKDSIYNKEKSEKIAEQKIQYEYDKKAAIDKLIFDQEIETSKNFQILLGVGLLFLLVLTFLAYRAYRIKTKSNEIISKQRDQLHVLNDANENLIFSLSHDIKEPLLGIQLLIKKLPTQDEILNKVSQSLTTQIKSINGIVNNLLEIKRADKIGAENMATMTVINSTIEKVISSLSIKMEEKNISVENTLDPNTNFTLPLSVQKLYLLILNLLSNAIKFSEKNEKIQIYLDGDAICIRDFGCGINQKSIDNIYNSEKSDSQGQNGSGIGLILVSNILKNTDVKMSFSAPDGGGTLVKIISS